MAIKGLSDQRIIPTVGKIKTGIKVQGKKGEYPQETEYFVLNPIEEILDKDGNFTGKTRTNTDIQGLIDLLGKEPVEMVVCFPVDHPSVLPDPHMEWYLGNAKKKKAICVCRGNGEYAHYKGKDRVSGLDATQYPQGFNRVCNIDLCPQAKEGKCKPMMRMWIVVPEYSLYAAFQLTTTSHQAIKSILSSIDIARGGLMKEGIHSIAWVPFRLYRERTPNSHGGVNYIMRCMVHKQRLDQEVKNLKEGKQSLLGMSSQNLLLDADPSKAEPEYDLLPQSEHGRAQTGDPIVVDVLPPIDKESWIKEKDVLKKFKALSALIDQPLTDARMAATASKFDDKGALIAYLDEKLEAGQTQPKA